MESSSKVYESLLNNKVVNNLIYGYKWRKAIKKKLQNLENHLIWEYDDLLLRQKAIRCRFLKSNTTPTAL